VEVEVEEFKWEVQVVEVQVVEVAEVEVEGGVREGRTRLLCARVGRRERRKLAVCLNH